jgi:DNA-binding transcriptional regulator YdaS (Cro superfamily)
MNDIDPKTALRKAAEILGGQAAIATLLGYEDRRNVAPWFTTDRPFPAEHCLLIERATRAKGGELVTCEQLRPDVAWQVLRDQAGAAAVEQG